MSEQPWMPLFCDAFLADTLHLSAAEVGAYSLLLMAMWRNGGSVPDDDKDLARITRAGRRWNKVRARLAPMLTCVDGRVTQKRLLKEWNYATNLRQKQSENAKARWNKTKDIGDATAYAKPMPNACPHTHTHIKEDRGPSARDHLLAVLDEERAQAVVEHRNKIKKALSPYAAKLLAGKFGKCRDPNAAADAMIANGWQGFEPEWLENRKGNGKQAPPGGAPTGRRWFDVRYDYEQKYGAQAFERYKSDMANV